MKNNLLRILSLAVLVALLAVIVPSPAYAQAPAISAVTPQLIYNNVDNIITIAGANFDPTSQVSLGGTALLRLTQDVAEITARVPAGFTPGSYDVTVTTSMGSISCPAPCVTVAAPPSTSTPVPVPFSRPQFVVRASRIAGTVQTGAEVTLRVVIENAGFATAYSTQAAFTSADLLATKTGGIAAIGTVDYDVEVDVSQTFYVSAQIYGQSVIVVDMTLTYYDETGATYSDKFTLSVPVTGASVSGGSAAATATPTGVKSSQLVITGYEPSIDLLQPGVQFALNLTVQNMGNAKAQRITMIVGGGSSGSSGSLTPQPGGVSGGSGDFANFAPVGASNVQSLGDLSAGDTTRVSQNLIVNVSTNPGAYPVRITFSYLNDKNEVINDEQVITLLVYSLPNVDVSFYRPPDPFFAGQPGMLPIQVVNISRRLSVLGNIKIETDGGFIENGTGLVGSLDAGGYFTLDSMLTPNEPGTVTLDITIDYIDDFNQARTLERTLEVEVMEAMIDPSMDPSINGGGGGGEFIDGGFPSPAEETVWQKIWRFILGLLGLDSSRQSSTDSGGVPPEGEVMPAQPIPGKGG
jgi:hypothetical protein